MPQSSLQDTLLVGDTVGRADIDSWLAAVNSSQNTPMCAVTFEVSTDTGNPSFDPTTQALRILGETDPLPPAMPDPVSHWNAAAPGLNLTIEGDHKHWIGVGIFPQGATVAYKAVVGKNESVSFELPGQPNRSLTVPAKEALKVDFDWNQTPGTEVTQ